jgi:hypothetical protein
VPVLKNINPMGLVDLPLIGRQGGPYGDADIGRGCLKPGETFDVDDDQARVLLQQTSNYEPADDAARAIVDELNTPPPDQQPPAEQPADTGGNPA